MNRFARCAGLLDQISDAEKITAVLAGYFREVDCEDAAAAVALLLGRYPHCLLTGEECAILAGAIEGIPSWLVKVSSPVAGDSREVAALLIQDAPSLVPVTPSSLLTALYVIKRSPVEERQRLLRDLWPRVDGQARLVVNMILSGGRLRDVPLASIARALHVAYGVHGEQTENELAGGWHQGSLRGVSRVRRPEGSNRQGP